MQDNHLERAVSLEDEETMQSLALRIPHSSPAKKRVVADEMFVSRREICQDGSRCELVRFVPIVDQLLPPSARRVGDVDRLGQSWEWRITKNKRLGEKAAKDGMHGILPL